MQLFAGNGTMAPVGLGTGVGSGMFVGHAQSQANRGKNIKQLRITAPPLTLSNQSRGFSDRQWVKQDVSWSSEDFILAHNTVRASGKFNFQGCKITIPTKIR